jgi:hypothetical protein
MTADAHTRLVVHAMALRAVRSEDFKVLREVITLSGIGAPCEQAHVVAEWLATYYARPFSVYPQGHGARMPRPNGEDETQDY